MLSSFFGELLGAACTVGGTSKRRPRGYLTNVKARERQSVACSPRSARPVAGAPSLHVRGFVGSLGSCSREERSEPFRSHDVHKRRREKNSGVPLAIDSEI